MAALPKILILADWFSPGYKAGGPIRSCVNLVRLLSPHARIWVITHDRDAGDVAPYSSVTPDSWQDFEGKAQVYYLSPEKASYRIFSQLVLEIQPDSTYLNSLFSPHFTGWPLWMIWRKKMPGKVVLAPRGMLHAGALQYKSWKKWPFIQLIKWSGLGQKICWHATDQQERADIQQHIGQVKIVQAGNIPETLQPSWEALPKEKGKLKAVFISRIAHKKNIHLLLEGLKTYPLPFEWDLYGLQEDASYWDQCQELINGLPSHIQVRYRGTIPPDEVQQTLRRYHLFVMPTFGENFGHAIFEAFLAGIPVLISDQTPWLGLQKKQAGWTFGTTDSTPYLEVLEKVSMMPEEEWQKWSKGAWEAAAQYLANGQWTQTYLEIFSPEKAENSNTPKNNPSHVGNRSV